MDTERWRRIEQIFHDALDREPPERASFLHRECGSDSALRQEIEALIDADQQTGNILKSPVDFPSGGSRDVPAAGWLPGTTLGTHGTLSLTGKGGLGEVRKANDTKLALETLSVGMRFSCYHVTALIGRGGMGEVYRARDTRLNRDVALKVLPDEVSRDAGRLARFQREAQILAALNHPNIAAIYGLEEAVPSAPSSTSATGTQPTGVAPRAPVRALVLELVEGPTLDERLQQGPLPVEEALEVARQMAQALEAAHERGIVHRDLKPANVKLSGRGMVKLLDFGIATRRALPDGETLPADIMATAPGQIIGTVGYMAPEQVRGEPADRRGDQFALGIILFEMLTARHPFARASPGETLAAILRDRPPSIQDLNQSVPPPLQGLLDRCLAKRAEDRYESTRDVANDLGTIRDRLREPHAASASGGRRVPPVGRTPLVGRARELAAARALLDRADVRLVTFTGAGGTGKTRLVLQVAAEVESTFGGGAYFVPLASITDPALVVPTIVQAVGARDGGGRDPLAGLAEWLDAAREPVLLVLDNFEQVIEAAPLVTELLERCKHLTVLVTSRAVLRVYGEHEFAVGPLAVPFPAARPAVEDVAECPAVALFVERATAAKPDFFLTPANAPAVAEICRRLDGLPLAIELAAARIRLLGPADMLQRLERGVDLLTGGPRDLPARQRTLRATIEWSHGLLTPAEQTLFRRLAVFVGGCTLEAAEAVCDPRDDLGISVLDGMDSLAGQSLLQQGQPPDEEPRFTMLETIREYATRLLAASPDETVTRRAHAAYGLVLAEEGGSLRAPDDRARWLRRCDLEHDNFRTALEWAVRTQEIDWGLRLGAALYPFWWEREHHREGLERLGALLRLPETPGSQRVRARVLRFVGDLTGFQGDSRAVRRFYEQSLAIYRALNDTTGMVSELNALAVLEMRQGSLEAARPMFEESLRLSQEIGSPASSAQALGNLGRAYQADGDLAQSKALYEQALAIFTQCGDAPGAAVAQSRLGDLDRALGNPTQARLWYDRALETFDRLGDRDGRARTLIDVAAIEFDQGRAAEGRAALEDALAAFQEQGHRVGVARVLEAFADVAARCGQFDRALRLTGAADALRHAVGVERLATADEGKVRQRERDRLRKALGDKSLAVEMEGWAMTMDAAIECALNDEATA